MFETRTLLTVTVRQKFSPNIGGQELEQNISKSKGPFTPAIFVAQLKAIFVAPKLQLAAISSRF